MTAVLADPGGEFLVACLCAQWCGTCRDYRPGFESLSMQFPQAGFLWVDIEDHADEIGDIDVENFPSILIQRDEAVLFFGTVLPDTALLKRLLETFIAQTTAESAAYAQATPERRTWQQEANLRRLLLGG
ncbi:thioredoxin family protein [Niveibacterium sp. 24ML]|uniref:thioredoxin family protein n=1 Tax=Niveibacterium sp. 24ML TaxID=2985512 RepID=UPI00227042E9|nr:thioredoxin family protein [Niveibacterium sp. 24ML]MCX9158256.1 thioredoxin family protein [Niveibacterium sp. 24ML]